MWVGRLDMLLWGFMSAEKLDEMADYTKYKVNLSHYAFSLKAALQMAKVSFSSKKVHLSVCYPSNHSASSTGVYSAMHNTETQMAFYGT